MESKNTLWLVLGLIVILAGAYLVWQYVLPGISSGQVDAKKKEAEALYFQSLNVGKGTVSYSYSYEENLGGYMVKTTLLTDGIRSEAIIESPFAKREVFYMENDTVICVTFAGTKACSSAGNDTALRSYLKGVKGYFFTPERFKADNETISLLMNSGALTFESAEKTTVNGKECYNIKYLVNYSVLSLSDSIKLGISQSSPIQVYGEVCYDPKAKEVYTKSFTYKRFGKDQFTNWKLLDSKWEYSGKIEIGMNLSNGTAISLLYDSVDMQNEFIACLDKGGAQADSCVFSFAVNYEYPSVCKYAGTKADICTMNFAIFERDLEMCKEVSDPNVRDDCRIEIAGKLKDGTVCDSLDDSTRKQYCLDVVAGKIIPVKISNETIVEEPPVPEENVTVLNRTEEESNALAKVFDQMENSQSSTDSNGTPFEQMENSGKTGNTTNGSG
jgi:hypothetical protein